MTRCDIITTALKQNICIFYQRFDQKMIFLKPRLPEAGRNGHGCCCGSIPTEPVPSELSSTSAVWSILRPWHCDICLLKSKSPPKPPKAPWKHYLQRNPSEKRKRQKKSFFIYGTTFKKNESGRDFQQRADLERSLTKTKNNYGRHPLDTKYCSVIQVQHSV